MMSRSGSSSLWSGRPVNCLRLAILLLFSTAGVLGAQVPQGLQDHQPCTLPQFPPATHGSDIFNVEQSELLGQLISEQLASDYRVLHDPASTSYLQEMANALVRNLNPPVHVYLAIVDQPVANAVTFPGGRIFVNRKLIAFTQSEDELAAVLAHEIGHVVTRDAERTLSFYFRKVLGVTSINSPDEVIDNFHRFVENARRKTIYSHPEETEQEQLSADRIAVWMMARAGYNPRAFSEFWDRFAETQGKTGSWLGDVFSFTKPEQKRLRMAAREAASLPATCIIKRESSERRFKAWQSAVLSASRTNSTESLHGVVAQYKLEPPLRPDLDYLRFSPDGKWIVAQDETSIYVLSRDPLAVRFQIFAPDTFPPVFSSDSTTLSFYDEDLRVQRWKIASGEREFLHDVSFGPKRGCPDSALSPDGHSLACIDADHTLRIADVETGNPVFERKNATPEDRVQLGAFIFAIHGVHQGSFQKAFSPDGRFFLAAHMGHAVAVDLPNKTIVSMSLALQEHLSDGFAFQGSNKLVILNGERPDHSVVRRFPSGEVITELPLGKQEVDAPTSGDEFVLLRPVVKYPLGVMNVNTKKIVLANRVSAFDMYDGLCVSEGRTGEVVLFRFQSTTPFASTDLPPTKLGRLLTAELSVDFKQLAISERARGAVWDLEKSQRIGLMRGYRGAFFAADGSLYLDFPRQGQTQRTIVHLDPRSGESQPVFIVDNPESPNEVEEKLREAKSASTPTLIGYTHQHRQFVVVEKPENTREGQWNRNVELSVYDVLSGNKLWSRHFPKERPEVFATADFGTMTLTWNASAAYAKQILSEHPDLNQQLARMNAERRTVALIEVVELSSGKPLGHLLVDTGNASFIPKFICSSGDYLIFTDNQRRVVVYSLSTGQQLGRVFGVYATVTAPGKLLAVENAAGQVTIYNLPSMQKRDELAFGGGVVYQRFTSDGKSLFVVTDDHLARLIDVASTHP